MKHFMTAAKLLNEMPKPTVALCPRRGGRRRAEPGAGLRFPHRYAERQADHGFRESRLVRGLWRDILPAAHCRSGEGP